MVGCYIRHVTSQCYLRAFVILCSCVLMQEARSIVSVVCGTNRIAWSHVDRRMMVLDWQQVDCPNFLRGTYMASAYLSDVSIRFLRRAVEPTRCANAAKPTSSSPLRSLQWCRCSPQRTSTSSRSPPSQRRIRRSSPSWLT